jgi:hypothetical protein
MSLLDKLKKNSTIADTAILAKSKFFAAKDMVQTSIPVVNVALQDSRCGLVRQSTSKLHSVS